MRRFFRKRLPAFLLTLVMVMTMVPAVSAKASADLTCEVEKGESVSFRKRDFRSLYRNEYSNETPQYIVFTDYSDLDDYGYLTAKNYRGRTINLSESDLNNTWFYYDSDNVPESVDYALDDLTFVANRRADSGTLRMEFEIHGERSKDYVSCTMDIKVGGGSSKGDITYTVKPGEETSFEVSDFEEYYDSKCDGTFKYVTFSTSTSNYNDFSGYVAYRDEALSRSDLVGSKFYDDDSDYGDYPLKRLTLEAGKSASDDSVEIGFTVYGEKSSGKSYSADGTLVLEVSKTGASSKGDITYTVKAGGEVAFDDDDFEKIYENSSCTGSFKYVEFSRPDSAFNNAGTLYSRYGKHSETAFTRSSLPGTTFGYDSYEDADYSLDDLSFVADKSFSGSVELSFTVYGGTGTRTNQNATGTLVITTGTSAGTSRYVGNIRYNTTPGTALQINANDIARLFRKYTSGEALQYLTLTSVPATGSLYYNYYNTSKYGSAQMPLTASTAGNVVFSYSPASASEYDLSELTYVPSGSNYCTSLGFTGYSSNGTTVSATILISVTASPVSEVYSVTTKGTSVNFPANSVYSAVASATGFGLSSIQLLELPASTAGVLYVGSYAADTTSAYSYGNGTDSMGQLRFIPNSKFTGSVSIPYVALSSSGTALGAGVVSIGVVDSVKKFTDISTSTWCYKYVTELASANVISGYSNGTFQEKNTITYGAALKLIMLAAGYGEQAPTVKGSPFSGYLAKAKAAGLVSGNPKLNGPITRLQIAQIAAKALKLSTTGLPSKKPFTDTNDVYVQALNAAGIIEGYFSNGTSTYKPNNTLTRGQVSAIVWRMKNSVQ